MSFTGTEPASVLNAGHSKMLGFDLSNIYSNKCTNCVQREAELACKRVGVCEGGCNGDSRQ